MFIEPSGTAKRSTIGGLLVRYCRLKAAESDGIVSTESGLYGLDRGTLFDGCLIQAWDERITLWYDEGQVEDYLTNMEHWPVISERAREVLELAAPGEVQFLPVKVVNRSSGLPLPRYYAVNMLNRINALDLDHAVYKTFSYDGALQFSIIKFALQLEAVRPFHVVRLAEAEVTVIISQCVKDALLFHRITGVEFREVPVFA